MNTPLLWIEDDQNDILLVGRAMVKVGMQPSAIIRDGEEAILYLSGQGNYIDRNRHPLPSLILLDLKLPKRSGLEVLRWLREQPILRRIPTIVFTSSTETDDINRAYELGANAYLVKPVDMEGLISTLRRVQEFWIGTTWRPTLPLSEPRLSK